MSKKKSRYVALHHWLMASPAWRSLPAPARCIYIEMSARYYGSNNGHITYSVREASEAVNISKPTACRMLKILQERGFIVCTKRGAFSRKTVREASEWCLTEYASDYPPAHATKDFMRWQPSEKPQKIKTRFHQKTRTVSPRNLYGFTHETVKPKNGPDGFITKPVKAKNRPSTVSPGVHIQLPGIECAAERATAEPPSESAERYQRARAAFDKHFDPFE